jgi:hypothetical protein
MRARESKTPDFKGSPAGKSRGGGSPHEIFRISLEPVRKISPGRAPLRDFLEGSHGGALPSETGAPSSERNGENLVGETSPASFLPWGAFDDRHSADRRRSQHARRPPGRPLEGGPTAPVVSFGRKRVETSQSVSAQRPQAPEGGTSPSRGHPRLLPASIGLTSCSGNAGAPARPALRGDVPTVGACERCAETDWDVSTVLRFRAHRSGMQ